MPAAKAAGASPRKKHFTPRHVISGGQTGTDRAGLDAALAAGIAIGGFMPKGALAEDGRVPARYKLTEVGTAGYAVRTLRNIEHSDATLILHVGDISGGTLLTLNYCLRAAKPVLCLNLRAAPAALLRSARRFLDDCRPATLNIAGPRESKAPGVYAKARALLEKIFCGGEAAGKPYRSGRCQRF